jgi:hypothetical protein
VKAGRAHAPASRGPLEVSALKRAWPAIQAEFKKLKPSRSHSFNGTEVEAEGDTLIVEFPADQQFMMELVNDSDTIALLRRSVSTVLGVDPPVEYRLGRAGRSHAAGEDVAPAAEAIADEPATPHADLEASVIAALGAEVLEDVTPEE